MNWEQIAGNWKQFKGRVKQKWDTISDDDLLISAGEREHFAGLLRMRYGYAKDQAEKELDEFMRTLHL
ncbi:MAG: CsbD family protein [Planctomycetes bacterium]|nr:CsbD family protein [Planctomycetota bacterium]